MDAKKQRLLDAAKRMVADKLSDNDVVGSLKDIGLSEEEAHSLLEKAKGSSTPEGSSKKPSAEHRKEQPSSSGNEFWSSSYDEFFGRRDASPASSQAMISGILGAERASTSGRGSFEATNKSSGDWRIKESAMLQKRLGKVVFREVLPVRVSDFDKLIGRSGLKRGDTILLSGGAGTGKTTFGMQSIYNGALNGEKGLYITLEETASKIKENMMENFNWDLEKMEEEQNLAIIKIDPLTIARAVEAMLTKERGGLYIEFEEFDLPFQFDLPFKPDRVVVDSLSALSIAFMENEQGYRQYLRHLFETLERFNSCNLVFGETEQSPRTYSRSGIEEFLADGVVVFYNIQIHNTRQRALEILKLRSSSHVRKITPYTITDHGFEIYINQEIFREEE